ncbi:uncharacterized protein LOC129789884 [Lutzomyia longipalpis]|uniref:uncharacterized protein LOC129789884 n=1 Tax=Lutzomyia longipalpis TaxID=7200 RepID=UPI0024837B82|nr:uncharacterized protein LOC129789884 [Lutzomyia longipalpis]
MLLLWSIILLLPFFTSIESAPKSLTKQSLVEKVKNIPEKSKDSDVDGTFQGDQEKPSVSPDTRFRRSPQASELLSFLSRIDPNCQSYSRFSNCRQVKFSNKISSITPKHISGMRMWKSLNLSGLREGALFAEEPNYLLVRREIGDIPENFDALRDPFIPPRGRKKSNYNMILKRNSLESNLFDNTDLFMPQRGKKSGRSKMASFDDIIPADELFFPNRGKKLIQDSLWGKRGLPLDLQEPTLFFPNRGKRAIVRVSKREAAPDVDALEAKNKIKKESSSLADDLLSQDLFFPNRGKKRVFDVVVDTPDGGDPNKPFDHQELLNNFSENHDTFYTDRGRQRFPADTLMTGDLSRANEPMQGLNGYINLITKTGYMDNDADFLDYYTNMLDDQ